MPFYLIRLNTDGTIAPASISYAVVRKHPRLAAVAAAPCLVRGESDIAMHIATLVRRNRPLVGECVRTFCTRVLYDGLKRRRLSRWRRQVESSILAVILSTLPSTEHLSPEECERRLRACLDAPDVPPNDKQLWLYVSGEMRCYIKMHTNDVDEDEVRAHLLSGRVDPQVVGYGIFEGRIYDEVESIQRTHPSLRVVRCVDYGMVTKHAVHSLKPRGWDGLKGEDMVRFCNIVQVADDHVITYIITQNEEHKRPYEDVRASMTAEVKSHVLSELCAMFRVLHAHSCYHCDLHTRNFLCDSSGNTTLFDFDLACCHSRRMDSGVWDEFEYDMKVIRRYARKYGVDMTNDEVLPRCYDMYCVFIASELVRSSKWASVGRAYLGVDDLCERFKLAKNRTHRLNRGTSLFTRMAIQSLLVFSDCSWKY